MIELLVIGATLTIAAWATGAQAHRRSAASRALDRYAQSRGLVFAPSPSNRASPRVVGSKDGIEYVLDLYRLNGEVRTRISSNVERGRSPILSVSQKNAFAWRKPPALRLGDASFDRAYVVTTGASEDAEGLREARTFLSFLDDRCQGVWLQSDGHKVSVSWRGMESDPLILDAARDAVVTIASWHRPESPYR